MPNPDRSGRIGGSDVPALFGLDPWKSYYRLWHEKAGNIEPEDISNNPKVKYGKKAQEIICHWFCEENGLEPTVYFKEGDILRDPTISGLAGTPDYHIGIADFDKCPDDIKIYNRSGEGVLEVKTTGYRQYKTWKDVGPPMSYQLQLQTYMGLSNLKWGALAIEVDHELLQPFVYEFKPQAYQAIKKAVADFWQSIKDGKEPDPTDADKMQPFIRKLLTDEVVDLSGNNELASLVQKYRELEQQHQNARVNVLKLDQPKYHAFYDIQKYLADNKITAKRIKVGDAELITTITKEVPVKAFVRPAKQSFKIKYQHEGVNENE